MDNVFRHIWLLYHYVQTNQTCQKNQNANLKSL